MDRRTAILLTLAARIDRLFFLSRATYPIETDQVIHERRTAYGTVGMRLDSGDDRVDFHRHLDGLAAGGEVTICAQSGRRVGVRITQRAYSFVRRLIGTETAADGWPALKVLARTERRLGKRALPEHIPAGIDEWRGTPEHNAALSRFHYALEPLLPWHYVVARHDSAQPRRYWLGLTDVGRAALAAGPPVDSKAAVDQAAADVYDRAWRAYGAELLRAEPEHSQDLQIPMPCGIGWGSLAALRK